ncbi:TetR/AcrR family transcriptional regulator C-terminal domain-containing protein [Micromonospora sp. DT48]|uniref:TetR/AcrR family transcriptional regulator C-terminal domain-containing protein n=1 Tax=unclassified Micromonospora TaxID=2617518 RepID=UPI0012BC799A|nr:TetR/AcrR family transcriptional regulator C-terminal domain-containing protein [Micromonospora sp. CP22]MTK03407.1 TetR family transcriptional regulator [Micromonospora sp. CP22]
MLRKADVVDGALKLLDAEGIDGLTMRRLGAALNVQGSALYRHFPNKEALLDALADRIVDGLGDPLPEADWRRQLYVLGDRMRSAMLAHRDGARVVGGTFAPGLNTMRGADRAITALCTAGLAPAQAGWLAFALFYYVLGHVIEEQALAELPAGDTWRQRIEKLDAEMSTHHSAALAALTGADPGERFRYGLQVFIDGVAQQIDRAES